MKRSFQHWKIRYNRHRLEKKQLRLPKKKPMISGIKNYGVLVAQLFGKIAGIKIRIKTGHMVISVIISSIMVLQRNAGNRD